jgi:hypothetical protein
MSILGQENEYHVELELRVAFNHMRQKSGLHSSSHCDCNCEAVYQSIYGSTNGCMGSRTMFLGLTMYNVGIYYLSKDLHVVWHVQDCVFGDCEYCGVDNLPICLVEEEGASSALVNWKDFKKW